MFGESAPRKPDLSLIPALLPDIEAALDEIDRIGYDDIPRLNAEERTELEEVLGAGKAAIGMIDPDVRLSGLRNPSLSGPEHLTRERLGWLSLLFNSVLESGPGRRQYDQAWTRGTIRDLRRAAAVTAVAESATAKVVESVDGRDDRETPAAKLPRLKTHDRQAWQLWKLAGKDQTEVARLLNEEHGTTYVQGQVSRMCDRFQGYIEAGGVAGELPKPVRRARGVDPARLELGPRTDRRPPRPSDMARANDDDE